MKNSKVYQAVLPLLAHAQNQARTATIEAVQLIRDRIEKFEGDYNLIAPNTKTSWDSDYKQKKAYRNFVSCITKDAVEVEYYRSRRPNETYAVKIDEEAVLKLIDRALEDAAEQFEAYVVKLIVKINSEVSSAELSGDPWSYSFLTVETAEGKQVWKTHQIVNFSKYNKAFNQFPTKKVA